MNGQKFYIWSFQHHAWWRPGCNGYTGALNEAGMYSLKDAVEICKQANVNVHPNKLNPVIGKEMCEAMVPVIARNL